MKLSKDKLKALMAERDINTFGELAIAIDVAPETMSRYLTGQYRPSWDKLEAICKVLGCTVDDIVSYPSLALA